MTKKTNLFPTMLDTPGMRIVPVIIYWFFAFVGIPTFIPMLATGLWDDLSVTSWIELGAYLINCICVAALLREYLADGFFNLRLNPGEIFKTAGIALGLMLVFVVTASLPGSMSGLFAGSHMDSFPVTEVTIALTPGLLAEERPIFGILAMTVLSPISVCGLFYVVAFAPVCGRSRWLGYPVVALVILLPVLFNIAWRGQGDLVLPMYLLRLPVHLLACWSYQKTDCVWTPIISLAALNLLTGIPAAVLY